MLNDNFDEFKNIDANEDPIIEPSSDDGANKKSNKKKYCHKKMYKELKEQNKMLRSLCNHLGVGQAAEAPTISLRGKKLETKTEVSFLRRLGDAVIKAVPEILKATITVILGYVFSENITLNLGKNKKRRIA